MKCNTILYVRDQQRATTFYESVLCQQPTLNVPGMTDFRLSGDHFLGLMPEAGIKRLLGERFPDPISKTVVPRAEIYLSVDDPERHHSLALANGAKELSPFEKRNWGDFAAYSLDLDGHVLVFAKSSQVPKHSATPKHISVAINRSAQDVYTFAATPTNLTKWASGLSSGAAEDHGDVAVVDSPMGRIRVRFAPKNQFGILDHDVTLDSGETFHNPMRVVPNGDGSEVTFVLFRLANMTDGKFEEDAALVLKDLLKLKSLMEEA